MLAEFPQFSKDVLFSWLKLPSNRIVSGRSIAVRDELPKMVIFVPADCKLPKPPKVSSAVISLIFTPSAKEDMSGKSGIAERPVSLISISETLSRLGKLGDAKSASSL